MQFNIALQSITCILDACDIQTANKVINKLHKDYARREYRNNSIDGMPTDEELYQFIIKRLKIKVI